MFELHPQLGRDGETIGTLKLCRVLLMNDSRYPWLILVPERPGVSEIHELEAEDRALLMEEIVRASGALETLFGPDKINIGALGNIVPQLHVHVIARNRDDPAWPGPVWGHSAPVPYGEEELTAMVARLGTALL